MKKTGRHLFLVLLLFCLVLIVPATAWENGKIALPISIEFCRHAEIQIIQTAS